MTHAVLQRDAQAPIENQTYETAVVIAGMNKALCHRQIITMDEFADMRQGREQG